MFAFFKKNFLVFSFALLIATTVSAADDQTAETLQLLMKNEKIKLAETLIAPFTSGAEQIDVIVVIEASSKANELAEVSAKSTNEAKFMFTGSNAPTFYDLRNESVKNELKEAVSQKIDGFIDSLDTDNIKVDREFTYFFGFSASVTLDGLRQLANNPEVLSVEEDRILYPHLDQGIPLMNGISSRSAYDGSGLSIAICDTGIDTSHAMLGGGGAPIFNSKVIGGYDTGESDADPRPSGNAHGTACAGIAAGDIGFVGDYIGGVAPAAKLYAIKISNDTNHSASASSMIAGWEWAITHQNDDPNNPIMIISTSFGGGQFFSTCDSASSGMTTAAANAVAAGITIFVSSGNDGYCDSMGWPACISYVNSVGAVYDASFGNYYPCVASSSCATKYATAGCSSGYYSIDSTAADMVTSYSNSASFLTMFAPANNAYTTDIVGANGYSGGDYTSSFGGTSAACPYAAGAAAVLQSAAKSIKGAYLTPSEIQDYLTMTGDSITDSKIAITKNRVNLDNAVAALTGGFPSTFPWPTFLSAITSTPQPNPVWGADNYVCCSGGHASFNLTSGGVTKHSILGSCSSSSATWEGWQEVTEGTRTFHWTITTYNCGSTSNTFSYTLQRGRRYLFYSRWIGSSVEIRVAIYSAKTAQEPSSGAKLLTKPVPIADHLIATIPGFREPGPARESQLQGILPW